MTTTAGVSGAKADEQQQWLALSKAALQKVTDRFAKATGADLTKLGPLAAAALTEITKMLEAGAKQDGRVNSELVLAGYQQLRQAHTRDLSSSFDLGKPPAVSAAVYAQIPSAKREQWAKELPNGRFELHGLVGADHLLTQLANLVGLKPTDMPGAAIKLAEEYGHSPKWSNLGSDQVWSDLGKKWRELALDEGVTGGPKLKDVRRAMENAQSVIPKEHEPSTQQTGLGLKKTATERSNTGSATNATAIRAQLLTGLKSSSNLDQAAQQLYDSLAKDLKIGDLSASVKNEIIASLKETLKDPTSADGSVRPLEVLANSYRTLLSKVPDDHPKATFQLGLMLAEGLSQIMRGQKASPGLDRAFAEMAVWGLSDLTTTLAGKPPQNASPAVTQRLFGVLGQLGKNSPLAKALSAAGHEMVGTTPRPKAEKTGGASRTDKADATDNADNADKAKKTGKADKTDPTDSATDALVAKNVATIINALGITKRDDPRVIALTEALTTVLKKGSDHGSIALNGYQWIVDKSGLFATHLDQMKAMVPAHQENVEKAQKLLTTLSGQLEDAEKRLGEATEKESKDRIQKEIDTLESNFQMAHNMLTEHAEPLIDLQNQAIHLIAQFCMNEEEFKKNFAKAGGGAGGPGDPGDPGGPHGPDDPSGGGGGGNGRGPDTRANGEPNWFRRDPPSKFGLPGVFSGGGPNDTGEDKTIQQNRAMKCAAILADPSLSIEDKIFLFMMWFVAFTDREREKQLEDIVGMDRRQAARGEAIEKHNQKAKSQKEENGRAYRDYQTAVKEAEGAKGKFGEGSDQYKAATAKANDLKGRYNTGEERLKGINDQIAEWRRDSDSAPQSREVKFTELQRLSQLRDNILNMARSIMETSNRNIEKVFR